jgi:hypothetical protein
LSLNGPTIFDGTTIQGTYRASVSNLTFKSGSISTSELYVPAGGTVTFSGTSTRNLDRVTVTVAGTANWDGTGSLKASSFGTSRIQIQPSGALNILPAATANIYGSSSSTPVTLSNAGLLKVDRGSLTLGSELENAGTIRVAGGSLTLDAFRTATNSGAIELESGGKLVVHAALLNNGLIHANGDNLVVEGPGTLHNAGTLRIDAGTVNATTQAFNTSNIEVNAGGSLVVKNYLDNSGVMRLNGGTLTVSYGASFFNSGTVRLDAGFARIDAVSKNSGAFELNAAGATINTTSPSPSVPALIAQGYHGGAWDGPGIVSVPARTNPAMAVGYGYASELGITGSWMGGTVTSYDLLLRSTLSGDANLDGVVDFNDLVKLAQNYNAKVTTSPGHSAWVAGDFTYDNLVDFSDLVKLAQNYNSALPATPIPGAGAAFEQDLAAAFASVPEPASLAWVLGAGALGLTARRRRAPA